MAEPLFLYVTAPNLDEANAIGENLVREGAAACVNIIPGMKSIYWWETRIERADEVVLIVKTTDRSAGKCRDIIARRHSHDVPAIAAIRLDEAQSSPDFCAWLKSASGA